MTRSGSNGSVRSRVHERAVIDESQGPVRVSDSCEIHAHAILKGPLILAPGVKIYPGAVIGFEPEFYPPRFADYDKPIEIGEGTTIRENVIIQRAPIGEGTHQTRIGRNCYVMAGCHIAHECIIEDEVIMAPRVILAGHVHVMWRAFLGMGSVVHQRAVVGSVAIVGMGCAVKKNVEPGAKLQGFPARAIGQNEIGLERAGVEPQGLRMQEERERWKRLCGLEPGALRVGEIPA